MPDPSERSRARMGQLNDAFRRSFIGGLVVTSSGVGALPAAQRACIFTAVQGFDDFNADNDSHGEHDFGVVEAGDARCFWKIDYYDSEMEFMSPDPTNPSVTKRVLTIMLADEY